MGSVVLTTVVGKLGCLKLSKTRGESEESMRRFRRVQMNNGCKCVMLQRSLLGVFTFTFISILFLNIFFGLFSLYLTIQ